MSEAQLARLAHQISFARDRLSCAQSDQDIARTNAWLGYIQALQWVRDDLAHPYESPFGDETDGERANRERSKAFP